MNALLTDAIVGDRIEAAAMRDLFAAAPASTAQALGLQVRDAGGATLLAATALPDPMLNRAIGFGNDRAATQDDLDAVIAAFADAGVSRYWIHLNPIAQPPAIADWLEARGFVMPRRRSWVRMICHSMPVLPARTSLAIRPTRRDDVAQTVAAIRESFGLPASMQPWLEALVGRPRWQTFVVADGDRIAGGAFVFIEPALRASWLGLAGVRAGHRGRGAQRALIAARVQATLDAGCDAAHSETGEPIADEPNPSLRNLERSGFARVVSRLNYASPTRD